MMQNGNLMPLVNRNDQKRLEKENTPGFQPFQEDVHYLYH